MQEVLDFWLRDGSGLLASCKYSVRSTALLLADFLSRLIVIPLCFLRRLDSLKYTSVVALISIGYLVILTVAHFIKGDTMEDRGPIRYIQPEGLVAFLSSLPVIIFAYTCHQNVSCLLHFLAVLSNATFQMFSILNEIGNNSHFRTTGVVFASIGVAAFIYVLVAITGYLSFGNAVGGNVVAMCKQHPTAQSVFS